MASVAVAEEKCAQQLSISSALEKLEVDYTSPPDDLEPCIKFLSSSPPRGQCLQRLREIVLSRNGIVELGDLQQVAETLKNARAIDLSHNRLRSWSVIGDLLEAVPALKRLDLSFNPLPAHHIDTSSIPSDNALEELALNGVNIELDTLFRLLHGLPHLKQLQISYTPRERPDKENERGEQNLFDSITELYMNNCEISDWSTCMEYARRFPSLQNLHLSENPFEEISDRCEKNALTISDCMPKLRLLSLHGCGIRDWKSIEALGRLETLEHLRIRDIPLFEKYACDERHHLTIPRIPALKSLNGSAISTRYREDCERAFIRYYQMREDKPMELYDKLVCIHGKLEPLVCVDLTPQKYVRAKLRYEECGLNLVMRLRLNITIRTFIGAVVKATGIPTNRIRVLHVTPQYPARGPTELRPSSQFMHTLRIEDGDEFHVLKLL